MAEPAGANPRFRRALVALIVAQVCLHACMAGVRLASPLQALRLGHEAWSVGVLMGLFAAAPMLIALQSGRLADRHGYHRPMHLGIALTVVGAIVAVASTWLPDAWQFGALCIAAMATGAGANVGMIAILRTAGRTANDPVQLKRVFSLLGLAPALANALGPMAAGALIDLGGFRVAFLGLALLPLASLWWVKQVPREARPAAEAHRGKRSSFGLLKTPGFRRLLLVNWLMSSSWDMHAFVVPILGHERGFSASAIGSVLGVFAIAVAAVRLAIPLLAHRMREAQVLFGAMLAAACVLAVYPWVRSEWQMGTCAVLLGLALGAVQPMIMTSLHHITPDGRHGEAIALRSMTINLSSTLMPLLFGMAGAAIGAASLFWFMAAMIAAGSPQARRIEAAP
jgi:MFS family permease